MNQEILTTQKPLDRETLVKLVRKWGDVNTPPLVEEACHVFSIPEVEGFIGYKVESNNAVVFGDPVCAPENKPALAKAFDEDCQERKLEVVYIIVSKQFADWVTDNLSGVSIEFGMNFIFDPQNIPTNNTGMKAVRLRNKVKHALNEDVVVKEYVGEDPNTEKLIEKVAQHWLEKRHGPQIYLSHVNLFKDRYGKRWFYAQKNDKVVGLLLLNELQSHNGWLLNNVMMFNDAPKGLSELMIISTLEVLGKEGCRYVLAGPVPAKKLGKINGLNGLGSTLTRFAFTVARYVFQLDRHAPFWDKFQIPSESSYLVFPHKNLGISSIKALIKALNASKG